jgi:hypothetical protein
MLDDKRKKNSYGLARRLALITGRLFVPSSLTLNGLKNNEQMNRI